jgi:hypothetical protein
MLNNAQAWKTMPTSLAGALLLVSVIQHDFSCVGTSAGHWRSVVVCRNHWAEEGDELTSGNLLKFRTAASTPNSLLALLSKISFPASVSVPELRGPAPGPVQPIESP